MNKTDKSNGWVDEFDNRFKVEKLSYYSSDERYRSFKSIPSAEEVFDFIQTQIEKAVKEERMRLLKWVELQATYKNHGFDKVTMEGLISDMKRHITKLTKDNDAS